MTTPAAALEARLNVRLAQTRRLVTSWLPPPTAAELASQKTDEQLAKEDEELFTPTPPRLGLGAPIPKEFQTGSSLARRQTTNDQLRRKIMGRGSTVGPSKPRPREHKRELLSGCEDAEEGRSSLGRQKRRKQASELEQGRGGVDNETVTENPRQTAPSGHPKSPESGPARFGSYLDAYKAQKSKKKKKKKRETSLGNE